MFSQITIKQELDGFKADIVYIQPGRCLYRQAKKTARNKFFLRIIGWIICKIISFEDKP